MTRNITPEVQHIATGISIEKLPSGIIPIFDIPQSIESEILVTDNNTWITARNNSGRVTGEWVNFPEQLHYMNNSYLKDYVRYTYGVTTGIIFLLEWGDLFGIISTSERIQPTKLPIIPINNKARFISALS